MPAKPAVALNSAIIASRAGASEQSGPKSLRPAPLEIRERHPLLLDPGEIAEVENPLAVVVGQFEHIVVGDAEQMPAEDLAGAHLVEAIGIAVGAVFLRSLR